MTSIGSLVAAKHPHAAASDPFVQNLRHRVRDYHIVTNVRRLGLSSVAVLLFMLSGCCKPFDSPTKQENQAARAWVTESWRGQYDWTRIARWRPVSESRILQADTLLQSVAVIRIRAEEVRELVGESNLAQGEENPYLLRAVADASEVFPLELDVRPDGTVWAGGGANSKCPVGMRRRPVVVWLNSSKDFAYTYLESCFTGYCPVDDLPRRSIAQGFTADQQLQWFEDLAGRIRGIYRSGSLDRCSTISA
jgi:hypothetical protein